MGGVQNANHAAIEVIEEFFVLKEESKGGPRESRNNNGHNNNNNNDRGPNNGRGRGNGNGNGNGGRRGKSSMLLQAKRFSMPSINRSTPTTLRNNKAI